MISYHPNLARLVQGCCAEELVRHWVPFARGEKAKANTSMADRPTSRGIVVVDPLHSVHLATLARSMAFSPGLVHQRRDGALHGQDHCRVEDHLFEQNLEKKKHLRALAAPLWHCRAHDQIHKVVESAAAALQDSSTMAALEGMGRAVVSKITAISSEMYRVACQLASQDIQN